MFYNSYRATKSAMKQRQQRLNTANPTSRLLNQPKRKKLKELLKTKFLQKYPNSNGEQLIENEVSKFILQEKLTDIDLQRLDSRIKFLLTNKSEKDTLKNTLTKTLQDETIKTQKPNLTLQNETLFPNIKNQTENLNTLQNKISEKNEKKNFNETEPCLKKRSVSSYSVRNKNKLKNFKTPEEELAELEAELAAEEKPKNKNRLNFNDLKDGDHWAAILKYNSELHKKLIIDNRLKEKDVQNRIKEVLDMQIKEKLKKEYEEELKNKEYDKLVQQHQKELDEIERKKSEGIQQQIYRLKQHRDAQLKDDITRKKIKQLQEKKYDLNYVKTIQQNLEKNRKEYIANKILRNQELNKALKENEIKKQKIKEQFKKEREDELRSFEEHNQLENKRQNDRDRYYQRIQILGNKYNTPQVAEILEKQKKDQEKEDAKIQQYYEAKMNDDNERAFKERMRRQKEKEDIKKFLDTQIEEKRKKKEFLRLLDEEQARIWNIDCQKYYDEEKYIEQKMKKMNRNNLEGILAQMEEHKRSKTKEKNMTEAEFNMNRELFEKANASLAK